MSNFPNVVEFGRWRLSSDREATAKAYLGTALGSPEECGCTHCQNFAAQRSQIYPPAVMELFEKLGIPHDREAEIYHMARLETGKHFYGGWFHFVGSITSGSDAARQIRENLWRPDFENASESFSFGFSAHIALAREPFKGLPLVQFEFSTEIPWIIEAEEPT